MPSVNHNQGTVKPESAGFTWSLRRGIVSIVALCAFIALFQGVLYGKQWETATVVFLIATFTATRMLPAIQGEGTTSELRWPDWSIVTYGVIYGLGSNWICSFLWFSRRYAFFSAPVVAMTVLIMVSYGAIALLIALLTGGNWRKGLLVFVVAPILVAVIVLRLRLLR